MSFDLVNLVFLLLCFLFLWVLYLISCSSLAVKEFSEKPTDLLNSPGPTSFQPSRMRNKEKQSPRRCGWVSNQPVLPACQMGPRRRFFDWWTGVASTSGPHLPDWKQCELPCTWLLGSPPSPSRRRFQKLDGLGFVVFKSLVFPNTCLGFRL